jgi:hypothetical protein
VTPTAEGARPAARTVDQGGRAKAYRPLPLGARQEAFAAGLEAYGQGDFFAAHEHLEPAWMGTDDLVERDLHQGLIKLAAGYVHAVRGNPAGITKNLAGARARLIAARDGRAAEDDGTTDGTRSGFVETIDLDRLIADIGDRLEALAAGRIVSPGDAPRIHPAHRRTA